MKVLSIDVGIKNLAYCIIENIDSSINILDWNGINLCERDKMCNYVTKSGKCKSKACLQYKEELYCKRHSKMTELIEYKGIPTQKKLKEKSLKELEEYASKYNLEIKMNVAKIEIIKKIIDELKNKSLKVIEKKDAGKIELLELGVAIKRELDKLEIEEIELILIENQIGPLATRMKSVQSMLIQYFIMKGKKKIECVSSSNKLKFLKQGKLSYKENKDLSKSLVEKYLNNNKNEKKEIKKVFDESKKKDDIADAFLQVCAYLIEKNKCDNIFNYADDLK